MTTIHYPAKAYRDLKREQLLQTAYALEDTRDRALRRIEAATEALATAREEAKGDAHQGVLEALDKIETALKGEAWA